MKTIAEFHSFFSGIPEDKWCVGRFHGAGRRSCALGHLGVTVRGEEEIHTAASGRCTDIFADHGLLATEANDGTTSAIRWFCQRGLVPAEGPKQRILAALAWMQSQPPQTGLHL